MTAALEKSLEPVVKEIIDTVSALRDEIKDEMSMKDFGVKSIDFAIERLSEAVHELGKKTDGEVEPDNARIAELVRDFATKNADEQMAILKEIMKNSNTNAVFAKKMTDDVAKQMVTALDKLVALTAVSLVEQKSTDTELIRNERDRMRAEARGRSEGRTRGGISTKKEDDRTLLQKLIDGLFGNDKNSFMAQISRGIEALALGIGTVGILSLIPKSVREFIDEYVTAFAEATLLLQNNLLKPLFKILEHIPILGAIAKKLPFLAVILAAFDVLPKTFEKFKTEGWASALETAMQGLYKFFVTDISVMAGKLVDSMLEGLFGPKIKEVLNFTGWAETFGTAVDNVITDFVEVVKNLWNGDHAKADAAALNLFWDVIDGIVASIRSLFKFDPEIEFSVRELVEGMWADLVVKIDTTIERIKTFFTFDIPEGVKALKLKLTDLFVDTPIRLYNEALIGLAEWATELKASVIAAVKNIATSWMTTITTAFHDAITVGINIKDEITAWLARLWKGVSDWIYDNTIGMLPGMSDSKVTPVPGKTGAAERERDLVKKSMSIANVGRGRGSPSIVNVQKSQSSHVSNFATMRTDRASRRDPLAGSIGGGGGW